MSKPVWGLPHTHVTWQSHQLDTLEHLPFSEEFETIQNQTRQEAKAEISKYLEQIVQ